MAADKDELSEVQAELRAIKKALQEGSDYLGMKGETLQRYFLQLNEKENLLLSRQLRSSELLLAAVASPADEGLRGAAAHGEGGKGAPVAIAAAPVRVEPRSLPPGPAEAFNKDSLDAVIQHLAAYEASVVESTKALRALSSLAYADAQRISEDDRVLPQVFRAMAIHPDEDGLQLAAIRAICNMAYSPESALGRLAADPSFLTVLVRAMAKSGGPKEFGTKASEAVARIVAAEVSPEAEESTNAGAAKGLGAFAGIILVTAGDGPALFDVTLKVILQLIANEVVETKFVAERVCAAAEKAQTDAATSAGWLGFAKHLAMCDCPGLSLALVEAGVIPAAANVMTAHAGDEAVQLAGIEGMSGLVGNRWSGLLAFAEVKGMRLIENAMRSHVGNSVLQTKGMRALASGIQWPEEVQTKASYSFKRSVSLTKAAMAQHASDVELQTTALDALVKYLGRLHCVEDVKADGGEGLVKTVMTKHIAMQTVQAYGKAVLNGIGADKNWMPKNA